MGQEKGVSTYGGTIDNKVLLSVIREIAISEGEEMTDSDIIEAENILKNVSIFTKFSLTDKNIFTALSVHTTIRPTLVEPGNTIQGIINVDMTISPLKSPIVAPENAQELNEEAFMGL
jgi:HD superfamily phosphohydrolase YqeK